jgi:hypothetical protein
MVAGLLVLGLGTGAAACASQGGEGPAALVRNGLSDGTYPYVVACQVFTGADVRAVEGRAGDPVSVQGTYGVGFPRTAPEDTAFTSDCTRHPRGRGNGDLELTNVDEVSIDQYPSTATVQRLIKEPPAIAGSQIRVPGLTARFGPGAILNRNQLSGGSPFLTFYYQNKVIAVSITAPPGSNGGGLQAKVIKLGKRILHRLRSGAGSRGFVMGPASGRVAGSRYFPPCKLLTARGVKAAFSGLAVDTTSIAFTYAEGVTRFNTGSGRLYSMLRGSCTYQVTGADGRKFTVVLQTGQAFDNISLSSLVSNYRSDTTDEKINGVGQAAKIGTFKPSDDIKSGAKVKYYPELLIGYPYTLTTVGLNGFTGTGAQRMEYLKRIARQMPAKLP